MKKVILIIFTILFLITALYFFLKKYKKPPIETKFVEKVEQKNEDTGQEKSLFEEKNRSGVEIKTPGNSALVANPKHTYQTFNNCGPATLSMILSFYGVNVSQKELGDRMRPYQVDSGDNDDKTIFTDEFVEWAKNYGVEALVRVNGDINTLKVFTANQIPVVVKTWLHVNEDIGHFRIVRGFDEEKKIIIQDDSYDGPNKKISYYDFLSMWQPFNYTYMVVYKSEQKNLVEKIIGGEMDEKLAWKNSLIRAEKENKLDPENVYPRFNISTTQYHLGEYQKSVEAYEEVSNRLPKRMLWYQIEPILAYRKLGNYDKVFEITDLILGGGNRAFSELYQIRGEIYLVQGFKDNAREEFELAIKYNKNYTPAKDALKSF